MRTHAHRSLRRLAPAVAILAIVLTASACAPAAPAEGPAATVSQALAKVAAKDLDGLRTLACAGQEDAIRDQLGLPDAMGGELLPGLDTNALLDAVGLDVSKVELGDPAIEGDVAQVAVTGTLRVTFDADALRPLLRRCWSSRGPR